MTLRQRTIKAGHWTVLGSLIKGVLQLGQLVILARLLPPAQLGLAAAAIAIASMGALVADLGVNSAYMQKQDIDDDERCALYFVNLGAGLLMTCVCFLTSPVLVLLVGEPTILPLLRIYSFVFIITAIGQQLRCSAEKRLQFRPVAIIETVATLAGFLVVVSAASAGSGAAAVIYGTLTTAAANSVLFWVYQSDGWRPRLCVPLSKARRFLPFGYAVISNSVVTQLSTSLDMLLGARLLGTTQFGLYATPRNLFMQVLSLTNPVITRIGFPVVAALQREPVRIARFYKKTLELILGLSAPLYLGAAVFAQPLVLVVFGDQWLGAVPAFRLLALWALCRSMLNPLGMLLLGIGRPGLALKWSLSQLAIALTAFAIAEVGASQQLALLMTSLMVIQVVPAWYFLLRPLCGMQLKDYLSAIFSPCCSALVAVVLAAMITREIESAFMILLVAIPAAAAAYLVISWLAGGEWIMILVSQLGLMVDKRSA